MSVGHSLCVYPASRDFIDTFPFGTCTQHFVCLGIAQCAELTWQLRGEADKRQVPNCKLALQHNIGLGGAVVIALYKLAVDKKVGKRFP